MAGHIDLDYEPVNTDLVSEYSLEPSSNTIQKAAEQLAEGSGFGDAVACVFSIDQHKRIVKIAYPIELFEKDNICQIHSIISENLLNLKGLSSSTLLDVQLPKTITHGFNGPAHGVTGIRRLLQQEKRPLLSSTIPRKGSSAKEYSIHARDSWLGGIDMVCDCPSLTSIPGSTFEERMVSTFDARDKIETETGEKKVFIPNITAETGVMLGRADYVKDLGGEYVMVDISCGWSALQTLSKDTSQAIHAGTSSNLATARFARLAGVDQLQLESFDSTKLLGHTHSCSALSEDWHGINPSFAVAAGGFHPASIHPFIDALGANVVMQFSEGCYNHPSGTLSGARAIKQSLDAYQKKIPLEQYSLQHADLQKALIKWGTSGLTL